MVSVGGPGRTLSWLVLLEGVSLLEEVLKGAQIWEHG